MNRHILRYISGIEKDAKIIHTNSRPRPRLRGVVWCGVVWCVFVDFYDDEDEDCSHLGVSYSS